MYKKFQSSIRSLFIIALSLIMFSCSDDDPASPSNEVNVTYGEYFPTKTGTWWDYNAYFNGALKSYRQTVTGTKSINGKTWVEVSNSIYDTKSYIRYEDGKYYQYMPKGTGSFVNAFEFLYFDESASEGDSWVVETQIYASGTNQIIDTPYTITVVDKLDVFAVGENVYDDVVVLNLNLSYELYGTTFSMIDETYYHANGVGIIKAEISGLYSLEITDYSI